MFANLQYYNIAESNVCKSLFKIPAGLIPNKQQNLYELWQQGHSTCEQETIIKEEIYIRNIVKGSPCTLFMRLQRDFSQTH